MPLARLENRLFGRRIAASPNSQTARGSGPLCVALSVVLCVLPACDPYSDVKATLSDADRARFERGMQVAVPCWSCHDITGSAVKVGPPLGDFYGRPVASAAGFKYSEALRNAGLVWNGRSLDAFLANVQGFIPGNRMVSPSVADAGARADLVFFLAHAARARPE